MSLKSTYQIIIIKPDGANVQELVPLSELNDYISTEPNTLTTIDLSSAADYTVQDTDTIIVVGTTDGSDGNVILPAATGTLRKITITNQTANSINVVPNGSEKISTNDTSTAVASEATIVLVDYKAGYWFIN